MKTVIHLIRHISAPAIDGLPDELRVPDDVGLLQGLLLRKQLHAEGVTNILAIFCSPLLRAKITAAIATPAHPCTFIPLDIINAPTGADKAVWEWSFAKNGGNYGYDMSKYLADELVCACYRRHAKAAGQEIKLLLSQGPKQETEEAHILIVGSAININFLALEMYPGGAALFEKVNLDPGGRFVIVVIDGEIAVAVYEKLPAS